MTLEVEVAPEEVRRGLHEAYRRLAQQVKVPGFRPGRVPPEVLRARLGRQPIYDQALELLLPRAYREAVEAQALEPVEDPRFDVVQMGDDKPLIFKAEVTVKPQVTLGPYQGVRVQKTRYEPDDADVEAVLRRLQERLAVLEPVDGPVQRGTFVDIDYDALLDGAPFRGGAARGRTIEVGREQLVPGFDEAIEGMRAGERKEFDLAVPEGYPDKGLAGKRLSFSVVVHSVKVKRLPELDDDLARDVGSYESLEQLKEAIRTTLLDLGRRKGEAELRRQLVERVCLAASVELPEPMIRRRTDTLIRELADQLAAQGLTVERYLELKGQTAADLVNGLEPVARRQLTEELVLEAVARSQGLTADPEEVERRLDALVGKPAGGADGKSERRSKQALRRHEEVRQELRRELEAALARERAVRWLVEHAQVEELPVKGLRDEELEAVAAARIEQAGMDGGSESTNPPPAGGTAPREEAVTP